MPTTVIIDYGSGNLHSAHKALERAGRESGSDQRIVVTADVAQVRSADRIVLPGVGAFGDCRSGLDAIPGLVDELVEAVVVRARPFLGICVGMQLMASRGLEFGTNEGFDWISGEVVPIVPDDGALKIPHMGWNTLDVVAHGGDGDGDGDSGHALLSGIATGPDGLHAYFVHSYHFNVADRDCVVAETSYGGAVTAMVAKDNMAGTQFHPEKSQALGLKLLANFLSWRP